MVLQRKQVTKRKGKVNVSNAYSLDHKNPIPLDNDGFGFFTSKNKKYLPFLDPKDCFFQLLLEASLLSNTAKACINTKCTYYAGKGIMVNDKEKLPEFDEFAKVVNNKRQSLQKAIKSILQHWETTGNSFINIKLVKVGTSRYVKVYPLKFVDCRLSAPNDDDVCESVFYSKQFRRKNYWSMNSNDFIEIPIYHGGMDQKFFKDKKGDLNVVLHLKNEVAGYDYYGMPASVASLPQQLLEYKMARYNIDNFDNNLVIGGVIVLSGNTTQEEADKLGAEIVYQHSGDGKQGRWVILSGEGGIEQSKIESFKKQQDGDFIELDKRVEQKIVTAYNWDPLLAGISRETTLGSGGQHLRNIYEIKKETVIEPVQQDLIIGEFLIPLLELYDKWTGGNLSSYEYSVKSTNPFSLAGAIDINKIVKKNEGREAVGLVKEEGEEWEKPISTETKSKEQSNV